MRYWKSSPAAVMAVALSALAFAATASATTVTDSSGGTTPTIHMVNENGHISIHNAIVNIECNATLEGTVNSHGTGVTAKVAISKFQLTNCTNEWVVDVAVNGSLEIHYKEAGGGGGIGAVTWTGARWTMTRAGLSCVYETNATPIGILAGEKGFNGQGTLAISANIPRVGGSFLCGGSTAAWTGSFETTATLKIDP